MTRTSSTQPPRSGRRGRTLPEAVVDAMAAQIRDGRYVPGDRLPTEPELMAEHGVSRTVVREAISRLQASGLVGTRHGVGTFVLPSGAAGAARGGMDPRAVVTMRDVLDHLELRICFEAEAAALAAARRTRRQLASIERALSTFDRLVSRGGDTVDADFQLHVEIALATGNRQFEGILQYLGTATIPRRRFDLATLSPEGAAYLQGVNREHRAIVEAIARKEPDAARAAMRLHLTNGRERLRCAVQERRAEPSRR